MEMQLSTSVKSMSNICIASMMLSSVICIVPSMLSSNRCRNPEGLIGIRGVTLTWPGGRMVEVIASLHWGDKALGTFLLGPKETVALV